jgi:hypothetical protein
LFEAQAEFERAHVLDALTLEERLAGADGA